MPRTWAPGIARNGTGCVLNRIVNNPPPCSSVKSTAAVVNGVGFTGQAYGAAGFIAGWVTGGAAWPGAAVSAAGGTLLRFGAYVATTAADFQIGCHQ